MKQAPPTIRPAIRRGVSRAASRPGRGRPGSALAPRESRTPAPEPSAALSDCLLAQECKVRRRAPETDHTELRHDRDDVAQGPNPTHHRPGRLHRSSSIRPPSRYSGRTASATTGRHGAGRGRVAARPSAKVGVVRRDLTARPRVAHDLREAAHRREMTIGPGVVGGEVDRLSRAARATDRDAVFAHELDALLPIRTTESGGVCSPPARSRCRSRPTHRSRA